MNKNALKRYQVDATGKTNQVYKVTHSHGCRKVTHSPGWNCLLKHELVIRALCTSHVSCEKNTTTITKLIFEAEINK